MKPIGVIVPAALFALGLAACQLSSVDVRVGQENSSRGDASADPVAAAPGAAAAPKVEPQAAPAPAWSDSSAEDSELSKRVRQSLIAAPGVDALGIDVYAEDALVFLVGEVRTHSERERIAALASVVDGVAGVVNRIEVADGRQRQS